MDNTNKGAEAKYWTDDFLQVRPRKDSFNQTQNMISLCKSFVSQLPAENGKIEKVTYMNRSVEALKEDMMKSEVCIIINCSLEKKNKLIIKYLS